MVDGKIGCLKGVWSRKIYRVSRERRFEKEARGVTFNYLENVGSQFLSLRQSL
jgi:hypothetical protein